MNEFGRIQWKSYTLLEITRHIPSTGSWQTSSILLLFAIEPTDWQLNVSMRVIGQSTALLNRLIEYNESEEKIFTDRKTDQLIRRQKNVNIKKGGNGESDAGSSSITKETVK